MPIDGRALEEYREGTGLNVTRFAEDFTKFAEGRGLGLTMSRTTYQNIRDRSQCSLPMLDALHLYAFANGTSFVNFYKRPENTE